MSSIAQIALIIICAAGYASSAPFHAGKRVDSSSTDTASKSGDMTYYAPGLGSCGTTSTESDPVVALAPEQYTAGGDGICGKTITINYNGKTATAKVLDKCMGCSADSIDVSPSVFSQLANQAQGRVQVTWSFQ